MQFRETHPSQIRRIPAELLEQSVINAVMEALKEEEGGHVWVRQVKEMADLDQHVVWRQLVTRVEVSADRLRITVHPIGEMGRDLGPASG